MSETSTAPTGPDGTAGESRLAVVAAVLLGLAATLTALSAYQAALQDGEVLASYNDAAAKLGDANFYYNQGNQTFAADQQLFVQYATAAQAGQTDAAAYMETLMRPELLEAVEWWRGDDEALTPFDDDADNPYAIAEFAEAERLTAESTDANEDAQVAGAKGDDFQLATVLLALTLFFAGIATLFRRRLLSWTLLAVGAASLAAGGLQLLATLG